MEHHVGHLDALGVGDLPRDTALDVFLIPPRRYGALDTHVERSEHRDDAIGIGSKRNAPVLECGVFDNDRFAFLRKIVDAVGESLFDTGHRDAVEQARLNLVDKRLCGERGAVDLAFGVEDILAERLDQIGLRASEPHAPLRRGR